MEKKEENLEVKPEEIENKYVFICFPPDGKEDENKRLLGKLEEIFPTYEFVFGHPGIWAGEASYLLNKNKAIEISNAVQDEENRKRARNTALMIRDALNKSAVPISTVEDTDKTTHYFFYWEFKKLINPVLKTKISNREAKELLEYLKLYGFVKEFEAEGKKRYCLTIDEKDERDYRETKMVIIQDKIVVLNNQLDELNNSLAEHEKVE